MPLLVVADIPDDDIPRTFISYFVRSGFVSDDTKPQFSTCRLSLQQSLFPETENWHELP